MPDRCVYIQTIYIQYNAYVPDVLTLYKKNLTSVCVCVCVCETYAVKIALTVQVKFCDVMQNQPHTQREPWERVFLVGRLLGFCLFELADKRRMCSWLQKRTGMSAIY